MATPDARFGGSKLTKITIEVDTELVARYATEREFQVKLENWLGDMAPCPLCNGEGWVTPQDHPIYGPQADQHCPRCHGEKWEAPF